ncbi:MAG: 2-oxo acid dehydrogenase subunit E2 [Erysipelotrichaceae bacterium]
MSKNYKKRRGDRSDGRLLRNLDSLHVMMPHMYPSRCDNEAFVQVSVDLDNTIKYLLNKNAPDDKYPYKLFYIVVGAIVKTLVLRPKMNYFIQGGRTYEKDEISTAFVIKKEFKDNGKEGLAYIRYEEDITLEGVYQKIVHEITKTRDKDLNDNATDSLDMFAKMPNWLLSLTMGIIRKLEYYDLFPKSIRDTDVSYSSAFITNLGSIGLEAGYHHLSNKGTNSLFVTIGKKRMQPTYDENGNIVMHEVLDLGLTIDERIGDGYYFSKTIKLLKYLIENPVELEKPFNQEVDYDTRNK